MAAFLINQEDEDKTPDEEKKDEEEKETE